MWMMGVDLQEVKTWAEIQTLSLTYSYMPDCHSRNEKFLLTLSPLTVFESFRSMSHHVVHI